MLSLWQQTLFANPVLCNSIAIYKECDGIIKIIYCLDVKSTVHYFIGGRRRRLAVCIVLEEKTCL